MTNLKIDKFGFIIKGQDGLPRYKESDDVRDINALLKSGVIIEKIIKPKVTPYTPEELLTLTEEKMKEGIEAEEKAKDLEVIDRLKKKWGL